MLRRTAFEVKSRGRSSILLSIALEERFIRSEKRLRNSPGRLMAIDDEETFVGIGAVSRHEADRPGAFRFHCRAKIRRHRAAYRAHRDGEIEARRGHSFPGWIGERVAEVGSTGRPEAAAKI